MSEQNKDRRTWIGVTLLVIGIAYLSRNFHWDFFHFPHFFYSWQVILMTVGFLLLILGRRSGLMLMLIGAFFLFTDEIMIWFRRMDIWWPAALIILGILLLLPSTTGTRRVKE